MTIELKENFFTQYGKYFSAVDGNKNIQHPFKHHPQFPALIDILSRKYHHHALLCTDFPNSLCSTFLEALVQHLHYGQIPRPLHQADLLFLNFENALIPEIKQSTIEKDFENLRESLNSTDKYLLIAITRVDLFSKEPKKADERFLRRQLDALLNHPRCRLLLFTQPKEYPQYTHLNGEFSYLYLTGPNNADIMAILRQQRIELERFHHVLIPEELLTQALLLVERYLTTTHTLEKTLLLLDSSAARASTMEAPEQHQQFKPVLTTTMLLNVLSDWTQIPPSHLQIKNFKHSEFVQGIQQHVFGQEAAITILGHELLQTQAHLQQKNAPLSSFLFAGPAHTGKKTAALALVEQLFRQPNVLHIAQYALAQQTLIDIKLQRCLDKQFLSLPDVIQQTPYAVILFENIEKLPNRMLEDIQEILNTGYLHDVNGNQYNFKQSIIILTTNIGTHSLTELAESFSSDEDTYTMDLMKLVMNDQKQEQHPSTHHYSPHEIIEKIMPEITNAFSLSLCQHVHLVPFLPLSKHAIEKIIRLKLKGLGKQLHALYDIELGYAPEVIRFLTHAVLIKRYPDYQIINPNKALKQLYFCVEQAILNHVDNGQPSNQLFLQLNETGQLLRCDWLATSTTRQHAH